MRCKDVRARSCAWTPCACACARVLVRTSFCGDFYVLGCGGSTAQESSRSRDTYVTRFIKEADGCVRQPHTETVCPTSGHTCDRKNRMPIFDDPAHVYARRGSLTPDCLRASFFLFFFTFNFFFSPFSLCSSYARTPPQCSLFVHRTCEPHLSHASNISSPREKLIDFDIVRRSGVVVVMAVLGLGGSLRGKAFVTGEVDEMHFFLFPHGAAATAVDE